MGLAGGRREVPIPILKLKCVVYLLISTDLDFPWIFSFSFYPFQFPFVPLSTPSITNSPNPTARPEMISTTVVQQISSKVTRKYYLDGSS